MLTVKQTSKLTGVSVRTLQYYDRIGLLSPATRTQAGYRLYGDAELAKLQEILLLRELEFSLKEIMQILSSPGYNRELALTRQIALLEMKKAHLDRLIVFAREIQNKGADIMDFSAFDTEKMDAYARQAKEEWQGTAAYAEFSQRSAGRSRETEAALGSGMMQIFADFGTIRHTAPDSPAAQALVKRLQDYITAHYYTCTAQILAGLGKIYVQDGEFTANIDKTGGEGTAQFASDAIAVYCREKITL